MNNFVLLSVLVAALAASAQNGETITFHGSQGGKIVVFRDSAKPEPRCQCATFTILVQDISGRIGAPIVSKVVAEKFDSTTKELIDSSTCEELKPIFNNSNNPRVTDRFAFEHHASQEKGTFRVTSYRRRCLNPTHAECKKWIPVVSGVFDADDLAQLTPVTSSQAATDKLRY